MKRKTYKERNLQLYMFDYLCKLTIICTLWGPLKLKDKIFQKQMSSYLVCCEETPIKL